MTTSRRPPRWGTGYVPADPRTRYSAALALYRKALAVAYGEEISGAAFAAKAREAAHHLCDLEVVVGKVGGPLCGNEEVVAEREPTPVEWADAAEAVAYRFCDTYIVRSAFDGTA